MSANRSHWSSRWAYVLVTAGSAIGLGNIWKFPYITGTNGGSAFVMVYLLCISIIGIPLLMAETMIGRRGQQNAIGAMRKAITEAGANPFWMLIAILGVGGTLVILSFYSVVAGWILDYTVLSTTGFPFLTPESAVDEFAILLNSPARLIGWHTCFMALTAFVVSKGITKGIERANKILMPALFCILVLLIIYGAIAGNISAAFSFMFHFNLSAITPTVILAAMGHSFFTLSVGMGIIMTYGSYLDKSISIPRTAFYVGIADTGIALMAGIAIFSIVFAQGLQPASGPGLILQTLPLAFSQMPFGQIIGPLFFTLVVFAAWTSSISLLEPFSAFLTEKTKVSRPKAVWTAAFIIWLIGLSVALSFNEWKAIKLFGLGIFDFLDTITSKGSMPLSGLLIALFVGWIMKRIHVEDEIGLKGNKFNLWFFIVRYISPLAITLIFLNVLGLIG